jgi:hypothetical protein
VAEFDATESASVGSYIFQEWDINGGDCFHPSIEGQNKLSEIIWGRNIQVTTHGPARRYRPR